MLGLQTRDPSRAPLVFVLALAALVLDVVATLEIRKDGCANSTNLLRKPIVISQFLHFVRYSVWNISPVQGVLNSSHHIPYFSGLGGSFFSIHYYKPLETKGIRLILCIKEGKN